MAGVVEEQVRALAKKQGPGVQEEVSCKGTPLESITFTRDGKAFLFVMRKNGLNIVRLKLVRSEEEGKKLAVKEPTHYEVGANGWTKLTFSDESVPTRILEKWVAESFETFGPPLEKKPLQRAAKTVRKKSSSRPRRSGDRARAHRAPRSKRKKK